jgi:hypothetical protein
MVVNQLNFYSEDGGIGFTRNVSHDTENMPWCYRRDGSKPVELLLWRREGLVSLETSATIQKIRLGARGGMVLNLLNFYSEDWGIGFTRNVSDDTENTTWCPLNFYSEDGGINSTRNIVSHDKG